MPAAVAFRYARALADLVTRPGAAVEADRALAELESFAAAVASSRAFEHVLLSPAVPPPRKRALIQRLAGRLGLSALLQRFLFVLVDHRRVALLGEIREAFESELDARRGLARVEVSSARELSGTQRAALVRELTRLTGKTPRLKFHLEPGLIGGLVARVGSTVYDGSVRGQLAGLRQRLAGEE
jgi:F-type H+-transporting ATPase subunit delta